MAIPSRTMLPAQRRTDLEVAAETAAAIINSGLIRKDAPTVAAVADLLRIPVSDIRDAWARISDHGYTEPRRLPIEGTMGPRPAKPESDDVESLIAAGEASSSKRIQTAARRAREAVNRLRDTMATDKDRAEAAAEIERLQRELAEAKAKLRRGRPARGKRPEGEPAVKMKDVWAWARDHGYEVRRGRPPKELVDAYLEAAS